MKERLFILLLIVPLLLEAQVDTLIYDGLVADGGTKGVKAGIEDFNIFLNVDFEDNVVGTYTPEAIVADWGYTESIAPHNGIIQDNSGNKYLEVHMPQGYFHYGQQWITFLDKHTELYISYNLMFKPGFTWLRGGKLPGFAGSGVDGGVIPTNAADIDENTGFSARNGWREYGQIAPYVYHHDLGGGYGEAMYFPDLRLDVSSEIWYNITIRLVMNTFSPTGEALNDGILEGYLDGKLMLVRTGLRFRMNNRVFLDKIFVSTFFGGSSDLDKPVRDEWIRFDDFYVFTYADDVDVPRGNTPSQPGRVLELPSELENLGTVESDVEPPMVPSNVRIPEIGPNSLTARWDPSFDNVGVTGYRVYVNEELIDATSNTTYKVSGLDPETIYLVSISAYDASLNESARSSPVPIETMQADVEAPTIPSGLRVTRVTGYSLDFTWEPSQDNVGVDLYEILLNGSTLAYIPFTSFYLGDLVPDTEYEIAIRAYDEAKNFSPLSEILSERTGLPDTESPSSPTGLRSGEVTNNTIHLIWNPSSDNVGVTEYKVYVNNEAKVKSFAAQHLITGLNAGLKYSLAISAIDEAGNESPSSDTIQVTTKNDDVTTKPTLPVVNIVDIQNRSNKPSSLSEMTSLGFTELDAYGIVVSEGDQAVDEGNPLYATQSSSFVQNKGRITSGLQVFYNFSTGNGNIIKDLSNSGDPIDLIINKPLNTTWLPGQGIKIDGNTTIASDGVPTRLINALKSTNEVTVEAWISQNIVNQSGPARIVTLSTDNLNRAVTLGHQGNISSYNYTSRLTTSAEDPNGGPDLISDINFTSLSLHHVLYTRDRTGLEKLYVNGQLMATGARAGDFSRWDDSYRLALANELSNERPWNGVYYLVAVYNQAFDKDEVAQNFNSGFGHIRYNTDLSLLDPNTTYQLTPFIRTDQGIVYGEKREFLLKNVLLQGENDSLFMAFVPNPNNGNFRVKIESPGMDVGVAQLRVADMAGQVHYIEEIEISDPLSELIVEVQLPSHMVSGLYSVILITGGKSIAQKMILYR